MHFVENLFYYLNIYYFKCRNTYKILLTILFISKVRIRISIGEFVTKETCRRDGLGVSCISFVNCCSGKRKGGTRD